MILIGNGAEGVPECQTKNKDKSCLKVRFKKDRKQLLRAKSILNGVRRAGGEKNVIVLKVHVQRRSSVPKLNKNRMVSNKERYNCPGKTNRGFEELHQNPRPITN